MAVEMVAAVLPELFPNGFAFWFVVIDDPVPVHAHIGSLSERDRELDYIGGILQDMRT